MREQYKILHLFRWKLNDIIDILPKVKEQGFNAILTSPVQSCREGWEWWLLYQPLSYEIGNYTGTLSDLHNLCMEAEKYDIKILTDVLFRNVASLDGENIHPDVDKKVAEYVLDVPKCQDYEDRYQTTHLKIGLPMVNYFANEVQEMHFDMLEKLYRAGVKGFRIDMAKHFATFEEGCQYFTKVFLPFKEKGLFVFGEVLNAPKEILDMYSKTMYVATESHMPITDKSKMLTFFESHDNYYTLKNTRYLTEEQMLYEWHNLVNNRKVHSLFFVRPMEDEYGLSDVWLAEGIKNINWGN